MKLCIHTTAQKIRKPSARSSSGLFRQLRPGLPIDGRLKPHIPQKSTGDSDDNRSEEGFEPGRQRDSTTLQRELLADYERVGKALQGSSLQP